MSIQGIQPPPPQQSYYSAQRAPYPKPETTSTDDSIHAPGKAEDVCVASTDKVDEEISRLKARETQLSQKLGATSDPAQRASLEQELAQIENEIRQKDNDAYRRQNTDFSSGVDIQA